MKGTRTILLIAPFLLVGSGCAPPPPEKGLSEDLAQLIPSAPERPEFGDLTGEAVSKLFENRYARADRIRLEPGIALPDHRAGFRAVYALGEFDLDVRTGDRTVQHHLTPGEVITWPAGHYSIVNSGEAVASFVVVSSFGTMPTTDPGTDDSDDTIEPDLQWEKLVFSSNQVDVMEATMEPGEEHPLSSRHPALVYALTPAAVEFRSASGEAVSTGINEGGVAWLEPEVSVAENTGNETARLAMFHFK